MVLALFVLIIYKIYRLDCPAVDENASTSGIKQFYTFYASKKIFFIKVSGNSSLVAKFLKILFILR